ncbi:hypothetical protein DPMN_153846 [Dreissena polymorpha]|uniref:Uncharacterized protein n=1 Tax=Dreissena polymorpha TaxID=45954 RepID=A0A9D4FNV3_DREPO|nr:hypothetical protein DPMN_153846 [Dreissena polymorpha]
MDASRPSTDSTSPSWSPSYCPAAKHGRFTTKYRLKKYIVVSILLYGCKTCQVQTLQVGRILHPPSARHGSFITKYRLYKSLVVSKLLDVCETWTHHNQVQTLQVPRILHPTVRLRYMDASPPITDSTSPLKSPSNWTAARHAK